MIVKRLLQLNLFVSRMGWKYQVKNSHGTTKLIMRDGEWVFDV